MSRPFKLPDFWKYTTSDKYGTINGIREDAPQWAKDEYKEWVKHREEQLKQGWK